MIAANNGHLGAVRELLAANADATPRGQLRGQKRTAMEFAQMKGHADICGACFAVGRVHIGNNIAMFDLGSAP